MAKKKGYGFKQGKFNPSNPDKCTSKSIIFRSSWELHFMQWCDKNPSIVSWSSEEVIIKYVKPSDGRMHRYFMDFSIKSRDAKGNLVTTLIEVKPYKETIKPIKGRKSDKSFMKAMLTYTTNQAKWAYTREFCKRRGWNFKIITEKELFN